MSALVPLVELPALPSYWSPLEVAFMTGLLVLAVGVGVYKRWIDEGKPEVGPLFQPGELEEAEGVSGLPDISDDELQETADGGTVSAPRRAVDPQLVTLDAPDLKSTRLGVFSEVLKTWRYLRKRKRMAKNGYVKWIYLDGTVPSETYVKPSFEGRGVPEYEKDGKTYLFPPEAAVPDSKTGMWVFAHHREGADPINLREPGENALPPDTLKEYLDMGVSASAPSLLDKLGFASDPKKLIYYAILAIMAYGVIGGVLQNGF